MCTYEYPQRTEGGTRSPRTGLHTVVRHPIRCWEPKMSSLEEHQELLATEAHLPRFQTSSFNLVFIAVHFKYNVLVFLPKSGRSIVLLLPPLWLQARTTTLNPMTSFPPFSSCSLTGELLCIDTADSYPLGIHVVKSLLPSEAPFTTTALKFLWPENLACVYPLKENSHY